MWVIGKDPTEEPAARLARAYLEELLSAEEAKKNAGRLGDKTGEVHVRAQQDYDDLKRQLLNRFPGATKAELGERVLLGQRLPNPESCVAWMYKLLEERAGSSVKERAALGVYGFLSNMTHPTLYPARQMREWADDPATGHSTAHLRLDTGFLERQASAAVVAFYNAMSLTTSYFGWSTEVHDVLTENIDEKMPGLLV